jgi:Gpi18-like mannosyltransferase
MEKHGTTEYAEERVKALREINILKKNKTLCKLIASKTLCSPWLILPILGFLLIAFPSQLFASDNLLQNGSFQKVASGLPAMWNTDEWNKEMDSVVFGVKNDTSVSGSSYAVIQNLKPNDSKLLQKVKVSPNTIYKLSCWIKAWKVPSNVKGANITVLDILETSADFHDTGGRWEYTELYGKTGPAQRELVVTARLGGYGNLATGIASFGDFRMEEVENIPEGVTLVNFFRADQPAGNYSSALTPFFIASFFSALLLLAVYVLIIKGDFLKDVGPGKIIIIHGLILLGVFAVRLFLAGTIAGYPADIGTFKAWSINAANRGLSGFYTGAMFVDYPPGYIYVLFLLGKIRSLFSLDVNSQAFLLLIKSPAILADMISCFVIFSIGRKEVGINRAFGLSLLYALNPAVMVNSTIWGQVDSVLALLVILFLICVVRKRTEWAMVFFAAAVLVKPQAFIFSPIVIFSLIWRRNWKIAVASMLYGLIAFVLMILPFSLHQGIFWILDLYRKTMSSYPYATLNAFNLFALTGGNWVVDSTDMFLFSYSSWGWLSVVAIFVSSAIFCLKSKDKPNMTFFIGLFLISAVFILCSSMHERYLFPVLILSLMSFIYIRDKRFLYLYFGFSVTCFVNVSYTLAFALKNIYQIPKDDLLLLGISLGNVVLFVYVMRVCYSVLFKGDIRMIECALPDTASLTPPAVDRVPQKSKALGGGDGFDQTDNVRRFNGKDYLLVTAITVLYAVIAFYNLGSRKAPETFWQPEYIGESFYVDLGEPKSISRICYFGGIGEGSYKVDFSNDARDWKYGGHIQQKDVYVWKFIDVDLVSRYVRLTVEQPGAMLNELGIMGTNHDVLKIRSIVPIMGNPESEGRIKNLFDEQETITPRPSFLTSTYFDEIYYVRTAYEQIHRIEPFENTHPPLGKIFISLGVLLFGMNPFGWRIAGTMAGIGMVPLMYVFGKALFKKTEYAFLSAFLMAFDFMHFAQSRIATIDVFAVFFIILMYYFMLRYRSMDLYAVGFRKTLLPLGLSGLFFGMGVASKWTGLYAGAGLALLFAVYWYRRFREYEEAKRKQHYRKRAVSKELLERYSTVVRLFPCYAKKTVIWSILFFILVPMIIYLLSFIPFMMVPGPGHGLGDVLKSQVNMYNYHKNLRPATPHAFSSSWQEWPFIKRPMWFYMGQDLPQGKISSIVSMGNPAVWWTGTICMIFIFVGYCFLRMKDEVALFILIGFASQYMPWVLVPRETYIYHFFASVPFIIFAIVYVVMKIETRFTRARFIVYLYMGVVLFLFALFYPILSGTPIDREYAARFLKWFESWTFFI